MSRRRLVSVAAFLLLAACPHPGGVEPTPGVPLPPGPLPTTDELKAALKLDAILYIEDDTYAPDPSTLIGKIFEVDQDSMGSCGTESPQGRTFFIERLPGLHVSPRSTPVLRGSYLVSQSLAVSVGLLSYLSASLKDSSLYSLLVTDEDTQRADDADASYRTARQAWIASHQSLMADPRVCWLGLVDGVVHKTIVRRHFSRFQGTATAGAFGVNIGGTYYVSDESYQLDHRFGLSPSILKRPSQGPKCPGCRPVVGPERAPTTWEAELFAAIRKVPERASQPN